MFYSWHGAETVSDEVWLPVCPLPIPWMTDDNICSSSNRMILTEISVHNGHHQFYIDSPQCKTGPHSEEKMVPVLRHGHTFYS